MSTEYKMEMSSKIDEIPVYGGSLPAPNVQEMVKNDPSSVPERYVRSPEDMPNCINTIPSSEIPQIDFSLLLKRRDDELKKLDKACEEWGFFHVR